MVLLFFRSFSQWPSMRRFLELAGCELFEIVQSDGYSVARARNDLKLLFTQIGVRNRPTVVLFSIIDDQVRANANCFFHQSFEPFFGARAESFAEFTKYSTLQL